MSKTHISSPSFFFLALNKTHAARKKRSCKTNFIHSIELIIHATPKKPLQVEDYKLNNTNKQNYS